MHRLCWVCPTLVQTPHETSWMRLPGSAAPQALRGHPSPSLDSCGFLMSSSNNLQLVPWVSFEEMVTCSDGPMPTRPTYDSITWARSESNAIKSEEKWIVERKVLSKTLKVLTSRIELSSEEKIAKEGKQRSFKDSFLSMLTKMKSNESTLLFLIYSNCMVRQAQSPWSKFILIKKRKNKETRRR